MERLALTLAHSPKEKIFRPVLQGGGDYIVHAQFRCNSGNKGACGIRQTWPLAFNDDYPTQSAASFQPIAESTKGAALASYTEALDLEKEYDL